MRRPEILVDVRVFLIVLAGLIFFFGMSESVAAVDPLCGSSISISTTLTSNLKNSTGGEICPGTGLSIGASDITLDCAGYSIKGTGSNIGVDVSNNNITIKNCLITNFQFGIQFSSSDNSTVENSNISSNGNVGIYIISNSNQGVIYNNTFWNNTLNNGGIYISNGNNWSISENTFDSNLYGVRFSSASSDNITYNNFTGNTVGIIFDQSSQNNSISNNNLINDSKAIYLQHVASKYNTFENNYIEINNSGSSAYSIEISSSNNTFLNNVIRGVNGGYGGISLGTDSSNNTFIGNNISSTAASFTNEGMFHIVRSSGNSVINNSITATNKHGIYMYDATAYNNIINSNNINISGGASDYGIRVITGAKDNNFTGNILYGKGLSVASAGNNSFWNTTFSNYNGSIRFDYFNSSDGNLDTLNNIILSQNYTYVNSTAVPELNTSARISMNNLSYNTKIEMPGAIVDYNDNGTYETCTDCSTVSIGSTNFTFDVTHFTAFSSTAVPRTNKIRCDIFNRTQVPAGYTGLFNMYQQTNSHAQSVSYTDYNYTIACTNNTPSFTVSNGCSGNYVNVTQLFQTNNSHVSVDNTYSNQICLNISNGLELNITVAASNPDLANFECIFDIYKYNNSHATECGTGNYGVYIKANDLSCGDTVNGDFTMYQNITGCTGNGIGITADNSIFDCAGYSIIGDYDGSTDTGISMIANNITVKNCNIKGFSYGIDSNLYYNSSRIFNNNITEMMNNVGGADGEGAAGIVINGGENHTIYDNYIYNISCQGNCNSSAKGIDLGAAGTNMDIYNNDIDYIWSNVSGQYAQGIYITGTYHNISHNNISNLLCNAVSGCAIPFGILELSYSGSSTPDVSNNVIASNIIENMSSTDSATVGMGIFSSYDNITDNKVSGTLEGFLLTITSPITLFSNNLRLESNTITNTSVGIDILNNSFITLNSNNHSSNTLDIKVSTTSRNITMNNTELYSIFADGTSNITMINLTLLNESGRVNYLNKEIIQEYVNSSKDLTISANLIDINSSGSPGLNKSATLYLYNAGSFTNPAAYRNGAECSSSICTGFAAIASGNYTFDVTGFTNYSVGELSGYNINVTIDNAARDTFNRTAVPYLLVINITDSAGSPVSGVDVGLSEVNGRNFAFPLLESGKRYNALVLNKTNSSGQISFVIAPTRYNIDSSLYNISINVYSGGSIISSRNLSLTPEALSVGTQVVGKSLPNLNALKNNMESWLSLTLFLKSWINNGKAEYQQINVSNADSTYTSLNPIRAGAINAINVTLVDGSNNPLSGRLVPEESDGFLMDVSTSPSKNNHSDTGSNISSGSIIYTMSTGYNVDSNYSIKVYNSTSDLVATLYFAQNSTLREPTTNDYSLPSSVSNNLKNQFESFLQVALNIRQSLLNSS